MLVLSRNSRLAEVASTRREAHLLALPAGDDLAPVTSAVEELLVRVVNHVGVRAESGPHWSWSTQTEVSKVRDQTHGHFDRPNSSASSISFSWRILRSAAMDDSGRNLRASAIVNSAAQSSPDIHGSFCA